MNLFTLFSATKLLKRCLAVLLVCFGSVLPLLASTPKLIVVISYDQLRADRLAAYKDDFGSKGFARVRSEGLVFDSCLYMHAVNMTAPGHSVLLSGCDPYKTGIVGNDFYDRKLGRMVYATEDTGSVLSPRNLMVPTVGQLLKAGSPHSKVIGLAIKDRAAILMTGLHADYALWLEPDQGGLGTSKHYRAPSWLKTFNHDHDLSTYGGRTWNASQAAVKLPAPQEMEARMKANPPMDPAHDLPVLSLSQRITLMDSVPWEGKFPGIGGTNAFPHTMPSFGAKEYWDAFVCTPWSIDWIMEAAKTCIEKEHLGKEDHTDMLCIGVSTTDEVGHLFGPDSREMKEILMSSDRALGDFIDFLDKEVGRANYELVISSDHGVADIPESPMGNADHSRGRILAKTLTDQLQRPYQNFAPVDLGEGVKAEKQSGGFVREFSPPFIFVDSALVKSIAPSFAAGCDTLCAILHSINGIGIAIPTAQVLAGHRPAGIDEQTFELIRHSIYPQRSGDIVVFPQRGWIFGPKSTTHGTPYEYDRHVPLMFFGDGITPGVRTEPAHPEDLAPTLATQLQLKLHNADGHPLDLR